MIDICEIINYPYNKFNYIIDKITATCEYRSGSNIHIINLECNEDKYNQGSVSMNVDSSKLISDKKIYFSDLFVPASIAQRGVGSRLMGAVFAIAKDFKEYFHLNTICILGWLSSSDCQNGNWNISLPFYKKVGENNNFEVSFKPRGIANECSSVEEYLSVYYNHDGDVIFREKNK